MTFAMATGVAAECSSQVLSFNSSIRVVYVKNTQLNANLVNITKEILLLLCILLLIPTVSSGTETWTRQVEFSMTPPNDSARQLLVYRLYKEGEKVCETNTHAISTLICDLHHRWRYVQFQSHGLL